MIGFQKRLMILSLFPCFLALASTPPQEVLHRAKAAQGGEAWDAIISLHSFGILETSGLKGPLELLEDTITGASVGSADLGATRGANGFDGKDVWSQDATGESRIEGGTAARESAVNGAYMSCRAYWYPQRWPAEIRDMGERQEGVRRFRVLGIHPRGGRPFELWVDSHSGMFDRTVEVQGAEIQTVYFSDYRKVGEVKLPFTTRSTSGETQYDSVTKLARIVVNESLDRRRFARPAPPLPDFGIEGGRNTANIPMECAQDHLFIRMMLNGQGPFRMLLDTGFVNAMTPTLAKTLGLKREGAIQGGGAGEAHELAALVKVDRMEIGGAWFEKQVFAVVPSLAKFAETTNSPVDGVVGYEVLKRFVARVDHARGQLTLYLPGEWSYKGDGIMVPFEFNRHNPRVDGEFDGIPGKFDIDTGSGSILDVYSPFVERHNLIAKAKGGTWKMGNGVGGQFKTFETHCRELKIGGVSMKEPLVALNTVKTGIFSDETAVGNVGEGFLKGFNITFDYSKKRIFFESIDQAESRNKP